MPTYNGVYYPSAQHAALGIKSGGVGGATVGPGGSVKTEESYLPDEKKAAFKNLNDFLANPLAGVSEAIQPILDSLVPSEGRARQSLRDQFRLAGALNTGDFAERASSLEGDILDTRSQEAYKAGLSYLSPLISGRVGALSGVPALTRGESLSQDFAPGYGSSSSASARASGGLNSPSAGNYAPGNIFNTHYIPGASNGAPAGYNSESAFLNSLDYDPYAYLANSGGLDMPSLSEALSDPGMFDFFGE